MGVCGNVCCVAAVVKDSVVCLCKGCDGCFLKGIIYIPENSTKKGKHTHLYTIYNLS